MATPTMNKKKGKIRSVGGPSMPFGMQQGWVDGAPVSRVVDQDHAGDGGAPGTRPGT